MISPAQKLARANKLGSSEAPAILGLDPLRSAADIFLEKTNRADGFDGNAATDRGNWLEPALIAFAEHRLATAFLPDQMFVDATGLLCANLDAISTDRTQAIEAKSTVIEEGWGDEGTDQVPDRVNAQVAHQFAVVPTLRVIWVPVVIPAFKRFDFRLYRVERNEDLAGIVGNAGIDFMRRFVIPNVQPDDYRPSLEVLKRVRREPNKTVEVTDDLVDALIVARAAKKVADEDDKAAQQALLAALKDAEAGAYSGGLVTYLESHRKGFTVEPTTFRALRIKANKGASK